MSRGAVVLVALAACTEPPPACIDVDTMCQSLYQPTFDNVYANTLQMKCGSTRSSCHSATGHMGGMDFTTKDTAFAALLAPGHDRVVPGDPGCSKIIVRTNGIGKDYQMPPGDPLTDEHERCALIQWVANGAPPSGAQ